MKILARLHLYLPNHCAGAELMVHEMLKALVARGHEVEVHLSRRTGARKPYVVEGIKVFPQSNDYDWETHLDRSDVLLTHLDNTMQAIHASITHKKPLVQVLHNTHPATRMWATCKNDLLVYNTDAMRRELGNDPNGIVVRPPVVVDDYTVDAYRRQTKITLINLSQGKGGVRFAQLAAVFPEFDFLGVMGAYGEQLDPMCSNVEIRPHGTDMRQVYSDTEILLIPSTYESYGRVGVEALCSGIPVLATGTPGVREALGNAAVYVPEGASFHDWANALRELIYDPKKTEQLSKRGMRRVRGLELCSVQELDNFVKRVEALV